MGSIITMRFNPARVGGRAVRQLVQTPFQFSLGNTDAGSVGETRPPQPNQTPATSQPAADPALNREASLKPETMSLRYPDALREARVEGKVFTQFVVNADGTVDMASLKVVRSDHADFTQAVRDALPALRFEPARVNGRAVRQLREVPFDFSLAR